MAIFGRQMARRRLRNAVREPLTIPAFSSAIDCSAWVLGGVWPPELATVTARTATLAEYLEADLQRIANSANSKLQEISRTGLVGADRAAAETRVIGGARAFAVLRVESTVRQLRPEALGPSPTAAASAAAPLSRPSSSPPPPPSPPPSPPRRPPPIAATRADHPTSPGSVRAAEEAPESGERRLHRLLEFVARQEPGLRWAVGAGRDGSVLLVTDIAHGWIPSRIELPGGVQLLKPGRRDGNLTALLGDVTGATTYTPGDRLGWGGESGRIEPSRGPRSLPMIDGVGRLLTEAVQGRAALSQVANTLTKAEPRGTGLADGELDLLRVRLDTTRYRLLAQYPQVDEVLLLNCMLLSATEGIVTGDEVTANYHFAWFQALNGR
ncbi:MAG TPA: DUF5632 domain-containing protein [Mycobacterium sp.]